MIQTVEKSYNTMNEFTSYKLTYDNGEIWFVPLDEANSKYQEILEWVAEGNTITDNGGGE
jgi:uncharacterized protein involved in tolerance to divalent cations